MSYRKEDIPWIIDALEHAREEIKAKRRNFICIALERQRRYGWLQAKQMVTVALGGHYTFLAWVESKDPKFVRAPHDWHHLRCLWIDKMIADLREYAKE